MIEDEFYDEHKREMSWSDKIEEKLNEYMSICDKRATNHDQKSKQMKILYYFFSISGITIPFILTFISSLESIFSEEFEHTFKYVSSSLILTTSIVNGINTFFNFGSKEKEHDIASIRYKELNLDIDNVLILKRRYRNAADVCLTKFTTRLESLNKFSIGL